jgi:hypothetical protein
VQKHNKRSRSLKQAALEAPGPQLLLIKEKEFVTCVLSNSEMKLHQFFFVERAAGQVLHQRSQVQNEEWIRSRRNLADLRQAERNSDDVTKRPLNNIVRTIGCSNQLAACV